MKPIFAETSICFSFKMEWLTGLNSQLYCPNFSCSSVHANAIASCLSMVPRDKTVLMNIQNQLSVVSVTA